MSSQVRYDRLSSLADVRAERHRLRQQHARLTEKLGQDCDQLTEVFTVDFWTGMITRKIAQWVPPAQWVTLGYDMISSLVQRRRKRKARKKAKKQKELSEG